MASYHRGTTHQDKEYNNLKQPIQKVINKSIVKTRRPPKKNIIKFYLSTQLVPTTI